MKESCFYRTAGWKTVELFVASGIQGNLCLKIVWRTWGGGRFKRASNSKLSCSKVPFFLTLLVLLTSLFTCETFELSEAELKFIEDLIQGYQKKLGQMYSMSFWSESFRRWKPRTMSDTNKQIKCKGLIVFPQCQSPLCPWRWKKVPAVKGTDQNLNFLIGGLLCLPSAFVFTKWGVKHGNVIYKFVLITTTSFYFTITKSKTKKC